MPYWVSGWIEILWDCTSEDEVQEWSGVINLDRFCLDGDEISNSLFGLAKRPIKNPYFANRGIPKNCSNYVNLEFRKNQEFIAKHKEGDFGHTYALWSEMQKHLEKIQTSEDFSSQWDIVFSLVESLCKEFKPEWIRFIVWGNW